ncbi:hypothetical protein jhhlp_003384 [Lomentospora prolificans]|uniref:ATPase AAA-type core domain-containing protein n=1 Tax=Lomentospora prolificans TaxID=41688 RepID=A0A2N3NCF9_9PEZI|nr:hypothetical protein jhhlp_003384 [Lomentospora prolificans]
MYIKDGMEVSREENALYAKMTQVHKAKKRTVREMTWSADFIEGKGENITVLLHERPGVSKTYTADYMERPLLSLTCSDIGVNLEEAEDTLLRWFKLAKNWGSIILIDEANICYCNHLVAGFVCTLEYYYKGIMFLAINCVGTFDEIFILRNHVQIHYPEFTDEGRDKLWDTFF